MKAGFLISRIPLPDRGRGGSADFRVCRIAGFPACDAFKGRRVGRGQSGMALVITLILLSVITFMAVTFLVLSRNEKGSVTTDKDQTTAEFAAETAQVQAQSRLLAMMIGYTNAYNFDLLVSTNYARPGGFIPGNASPTNVNYDYTINGKPLAPQDQLQNIANLLYDPRPPVFVVTNPATGSNEFRYYIDLNRNARFDPTGLLPVYIGGKPVVLANGPLYNFSSGDPQWIGLLSRPAFPPGADPTALGRGFPSGYPHSATNKFVSRYAYMVVPSGKALDINYIHNYAKRLTPTMAAAAGDGFLRDQGLGSFEINLGSFLADLNTNLWPSSDVNQYLYNWQFNVAGQHNTGLAFDDALALVRYRYAGNYNSLSNVASLFGLRGARAFSADYLNGYIRPPVMTSIWPPPKTPTPDLDTPLVNNTAWSGSDNPVHFFTPDDLFDVNKTSLQFSNRLAFAGSDTNNTYNEYTFYRLLSQLGGDSAPEGDQINLNYQNVDAANNIVPDFATNFQAWVPEQFFTNVANKLLTNYFGTNSIYGPFSAYQTNINLSHIPIYPTNYYTPSVHRLLQLAANIYDASRYTSVPTNLLSQTVTNPQLPTVFRPIFALRPASAGGVPEVFVCNYVEITNAYEIVGLAGNKFRAPVMLDPGDTNFITQFIQHQNDPIRPMVYGVPLVIGAKKGLPNFNEFAMQTAIQVTRKLEFVHRRPRVGPPEITNQMYVVTISNLFGLEAWNSYSNTYPDNLTLLATVINRVQMTNEFNREVFPLGNEFFVTNSASSIIPANTWPGFTVPTHASISFQLPMGSGLSFMPLPNSTYLQGSKRFGALSGRFETGQGFYVPHWWLNLNTRLLFVLVDTRFNRIVDYVNLNSWENTIDITDVLMRDDPNNPNNCGATYAPNGTDAAMWCTNRFPGGVSENLPTYGILNQIAVGLGNVNPQNWASFVNVSPTGPDRNAAIDFFRAQFGFGPQYPHPPGTTFSQSNTFYAPFVPVRTIYLSTSWQANDPLVHYTVGDLRDLNHTNNITFIPPNPLLANIGRVNDRYEPWGYSASQSSTPTMFNLAVKDPLVTRSDDWQFPTNKFPNIGWLGRVHRGTPWQTVYLKSPPIDLPTWMKWTGNGVSVTNLVNTNSQFAGPPGQRLLYAVPDAYFTQPVMDRYILDLFTTAFNGNAARGQMSINQTNLAAWSAILGGVIAVSNSVSSKDLNKNPFLQPQTVPVEIRPAGIYNSFVTNQWPAIVQLVTAINAFRATNIINPDTNYWKQQPVNNYFQLGYPFLRTRPLFNRLGEILEVPELTVASPFLGEATNNIVAQRGINDAVYERIPQQILGLLKDDPVPRFTIYSWGQALRPADRSVVTGGPFFGMCTNYQITAEVATRAVIRIEGLPLHPQPLTDPQPFKNLRLVIESYNVLPPD